VPVIEIDAKAPSADLSENSDRHRPQPVPSRGAFIFLILFGLPFLGFGIGAILVALRGVVEPGPKGQNPLVLGLFGLVFAGVGLGVMLLAVYGWKCAGRAREIQARRPDQPWLWREDWAAGRVKSSTRATMISAWVFTLFWNLVSAPLVFVVPREVMGKGNKLALLGLLFPVAGVGMLVWAVRSTLLWRKYGTSLFEMSRVPGVIGGRLEGVLHAPFQPGVAQAVRLTLTCVNEICSGSGRNRSTHEKILWQEESEIPGASAGFGPQGARVPVSFTVPFDCRDSDSSGTQSPIRWLLRAEASVPGVDYQASFEVPVFRTPESSETIARASRPEIGFGAVAGFTESNLSSGIRVGPAPEGGSEFYFGPARNKTAAFSLTAFTLAWAGAIVLQVRLRAPLLFPVVTGLFGVILALACLDLWFGTSRMVVAESQIRLRTSLLGLGSARVLSCADVSDIRLDIGMQSGGATGTPYYDLRLHLTRGRKLYAARHLRSKREAEWLVARMKAAIRS
jgi:hypothetical protein